MTLLMDIRGEKGRLDVHIFLFAATGETIRTRTKCWNP